MAEPPQDDPVNTTHMARMKLDRPTSAAMRPSASVAVMQGASAKAGTAAPKPAAMKPLYNLNFESGPGAGAGAGAGRPGSARAGGRMNALQAMRGQAYQAGSDDEDDEDENGILDDSKPKSGEEHRQGTLTSSHSTVLTPRGGASRKGSLLTSTVLGQPQPQEEEEKSAGVSDAMISARLKNAREKIQQREGADDPWGNGGDKGDETDSGGEGDGASSAGTGASAGAGAGARGIRASTSSPHSSGEPAPLPGTSPVAHRQATAAEIAALQIAHALVLEKDQVGWLTRPVQPGQMVQCYIKRDKSGFDMLYPQYRCYLQTPDGDRFIMAARKRKKSNSNNYVISTNMKDLAR